jgi:hypothetical protein
MVVRSPHGATGSGRSVPSGRPEAGPGGAGPMINSARCGRAASRSCPGLRFGSVRAAGHCASAASAGTTQGRSGIRWAEKWPALRYCGSVAIQAPGLEVIYRGADTIRATMMCSRCP